MATWPEAEKHLAREGKIESPIIDGVISGVKYPNKIFYILTKKTHYRIKLKFYCETEISIWNPTAEDMAREDWELI